MPNPIQNQINNVKNTFNSTVGERLGATGRAIKQGSFKPLQDSFQKQGQELQQQFSGPMGAVNAALSFSGDTMEVGTKMMPIEKLIAHEATDPATVGQYVHHINSGRAIDPLKIISEGGGKYGVEDGKHRLEALKQTGAKYAPVEILPPKVKINNYLTPRYTKGTGGLFTGSK